MINTLKKISFVHIILFLTIISYLSFGFFHLADFVTADEYYWKYERVPKYWDGILEGKWKKTYINDKPGVTLAMISGIGMLFEPDPSSSKIETVDELELYDIQRTKRINLSFRIPILLFNGLALLFFFWILKKIFNPWIALWSTIFIGLSPPLLGISQIINPDALLWTFSFGALVSYLALIKLDKKEYLFLTSLFVGLALLSKYTANILFPFFLLILILYPLFEMKNNFDNLIEYFKKQLTNYFLIVFGSFFTIAVLMPAVFLKPQHFYELTIGFSLMKFFFLFLIFFSSLILFQIYPLRKIQLKSFYSFIGKHSRFFKLVFLFLITVFLILVIGRNFIPETSWDLFKRVPYDTEKLNDLLKLYKEIKVSFLEKIFLEFNSLVFSITPIVLILLLFLWINNIRKIKDNPYFFYTLVLSSFLPIFYFGSIFSGIISTVRYNIMLYPIISLLAALSLWQISFYIKIKNKKILLTIGILLLSIVELYLSAPFYFNYTSPLLPKKYIISNAWGFGGYEAAQFINSQPNSKNAVVWSDYYGVCPFIKGKCIVSYGVDIEKYKIDYFVITTRGKSRMSQYNVSWKGDNPGQISRQNPQWDLKWQINIGNRPENYVRVYRSNL